MAACIVTLTAWAADPSGVWTWSVQGRDGQNFESTLKLEHKDGKLTGTLSGRMGDAPIVAGEMKEDGTVTFAVEREFNGNKFVVKYAGKLEGDKIDGVSEFQNMSGETMKRDWHAKRAK